jgi:hypothetical protein
MSWRLLGRFNARDHALVYVLATLSNLLLSIPEYLAVRSAYGSSLPVKGSVAGFVATYGLTLGITLDLLWTLLVFQALLAVLVLVVAATSLVEKGWRWLYVFGAMMICGFVGYWIGAKFLSTLGWVSLLQNSGVDSSGVYSDLFWFGLGAASTYVAMILLLRRSYDKLIDVKNSPVNLRVLG